MTLYLSRCLASFSTWKRPCCHKLINDLPIREADRKYRWPLGRRPDDHPGLSELGL